MKTLTNSIPQAPVRALVLTTARISLTAAFVLAAVSPVQGATRHWNGSYSIYWSAPLNWDEGVAPVDGDYLVFPAGASHLSNNNNISGLNLQSIEFTGGGYTLQGNSIGLDGFIQVIVSGVANTIDMDVNLDDSLLLAVGYATSSLNINGDINLGSHTLAVSGSGPINLSGVISGTGGIMKDAICTLTLSGSTGNTYSGETRVLAGTMRLAKTVTDGAIHYGSLTIGNGSGGADTAIVRELDDYQIGNIPTTINSDGWLDVDDYYDTVGAITFNGGHASSMTGTLALGGNVTVNASASVATIGGQLNLGSVTRTFDVANGSAAPDLDVTASISGTGGLVKTGSGLLRLLGANTYSGATTVNQGNVYASNDGAFGSTASGTTVTGTGSIQLIGVDVGNESLTLDKPDSVGSVLTASGVSSWAGPVTLNTGVGISTGGTLDFRGVIGGPGGFTKWGGGQMRLIGTAANTYLGTTRVNQGMLYLSTVGGAVNYGELIIGDAASTNAARVFERSPNQIGTIPVTINSAGELVMDDYVSDTIGALTLNGGRVSLTVGTLMLGGNLTVRYNADRQASLGGIGALELTTTRTFDITNTPFFPDLYLGLDVVGAGGFTKTGSGALGLYRAGTFSGTATINEGSVYVHHSQAFGSTAGGTIVNGSAMLILPEELHIGAEPLTLNGQGSSGLGALHSAYDSNSWSGPITLASDSLITVLNGGYLNLSGTINGTGGFTKGHAGTLILSGSANNVYTGPTLLADGILLMDKTPPYWAIGHGSLTVGDGSGAAGSALACELGNYQLGSIPITVNADGLLDLNNFDDTVGNSLTLNEGGDVQTGTGTLSLLANSQITVNSSSASSTISGNFNVGSGAGTFDIADGTLYVPASVSGSANITKTGGGYMYLQSSNSFTGTMTVDQFYLAISDPWALGSESAGTYVNNAALLGVYGNTDVGGESLTMNSSYSSGAIYNSGGSNSWGGPVTLLRNTTIRAGTGQLLNLSGPIDGVGGLTKVGDGTLLLSGSTGNTYGGNTVVQAGTVELAKTSMDGAIPGQLVIGDASGGTGADVVRLKRSNQIQNAADVSIASSGLFDLDGYYDRVNAVTGNGSIELGSGHLIAGHSGSSFTYGGLVFGSGYLWKVGTGTWTLTANNTYSGTTRIETGTLMVNGSQPGSDILVQPGGTLKGTGKVGDVTSQGTVAPGSSPGQLHTGDAGLSSGSKLAIELNGHLTGSGYDQLDVAGAADVTGTTLAVSLGYLPAAGDSFIILNNDGTDAISGTFTGLPEGASLTASNATLVIDYTGGTGNDVVLTVTNVTAVEPLRFTSVATAGSDIALTWEGGVPFYVVERKTALTNAVWKPVTPPMRETQTNLPMDASAAFYRVRGN